MFLKGKKSLWCRHCQAKGLDKLLRDFHLMVQDERQRRGLA